MKTFHTTNSVKFKTVLWFFGGANYKRAKIVTFILIVCGLTKQCFFLLGPCATSNAFSTKIQFESRAPLLCIFLTLLVFISSLRYFVCVCVGLCVAMHFPQSTKPRRKKKVMWGHELSNNPIASESNRNRWNILLKKSHRISLPNWISNIVHAEICSSSQNVLLE